jgi:hypothetical protein
VPRLTSRKLFDIPEGSQHTFIVGSEHSDWHRYAVGYKTAGDVVAQRLIELHRVSEAACLPALFLYRHYVELALKGMLLDAGELLNVEEQAPTSHPLTPLWRNLRRRIAKIERQNAEDWLDRAEQLIQELDSLDERSFTFRYPVNTAGRRICRSRTLLTSGISGT